MNQHNGVNFHISRVKIVGYLSFKELDVELNRSKNIIVGANGSGKTNCLLLIRSVIDHSDSDLVFLKSCQSSNNPYIWIDFTFPKENTKFVDDFACSIFALIIQRCYDNIQNLDETKLLDFVMKMLNNTNIIRLIFKPNDKLGVTFLDNCKGEHGDILMSDFIDNFHNHIKIFSSSDNAHEKKSAIRHDAIKNMANSHKINDFFELIKPHIKEKFISHENPYCSIDHYSKIGMIDKIRLSVFPVSCRSSQDDVILKCDFRLMILHKLHLIKHQDVKLYRKIQKMFHTITKSKFDIDYFQIDLKVNDQSAPSSGERRLIEFLTLFYDSEYKILLLDEVCNNLSSQNKVNFITNMLKTESTAKQLILVTHDSEMVCEETCNHIVCFRKVDQSTKALHLSITTQTKETNKLIKLIIESPKCLFAEKCLLVEGYIDVRVYTQIIKALIESSVIGDTYHIEATGTKTSQLYQALDILGINCKRIYDYDKISASGTGAKKFSEKKVAPENSNSDDKFKLTKMSDIMPNPMWRYLGYKIENDTELIMALEQKGLDTKILRENHKNDNTPKEKVNLVKHLGEELDAILNKNTPFTHSQIDHQNLYKSTNGQVFIIPPDVLDLEGIGKIIFEVGHFEKENWKEKTSNEIFEAIRKNINNDFFVELGTFLNYELTSGLDCHDFLSNWLKNYNKKKKKTPPDQQDSPDSQLDSLFPDETSC